MRRNIVETIIGGLVLLVAALFLYYAYTGSNLRGAGGYDLIARFNRVDGLAGCAGQLTAAGAALRPLAETGANSHLSGVMSGAPDQRFPVWRQPDGSPVSCLEKIKVLNENLAEIEQMAQDALEDAILMGCDEG